MTVRRLLNEVGSGELAEWMAFERLDPFGDQRADLRAGIIASAVVNGSMNRPRTPTKPADFMPFGRDRHRGGPIKLKDSVQHGKLLAASLFSGAKVVDIRKKKG